MKFIHSRRFAPWWIATLSMLVIAGCGSDDNPISPNASSINQVNSVNSTVPQNVFSATLSGTQETPPVNSAGAGTGVVVVNSTSRAMRASIVTTDIAGAEAHIHVAPRGVAGPVVFPLTETSQGSGVWTTSVTLTPEQLSQLQAGNYYFNVHTAAFPEGEIRGQITASLPQSGTSVSTSTTTTSTGATGTQATTPGTTSGATGGTTGTPGTTTATATGTTGTTGTSAGASGTGGDTAGGTGTGTSTAMTGTGAGSRTPDTSTTGTATTTGDTGTGATTGTTTGTGTTGATTTGSRSTGTGTATTGAATSAAVRPVFYTNVLSGSLVVPPTSTNSTATAITAFRPATRTLTAVIITNGITGTGANMRQAASNAVGPVVTSLTETSPGSGIWVVRTTLSTTQASALTAGNLYYEVLSAAFPDGELRGQIVRTSGTTKTAPAPTTGTTATTGTPTGTTGTTPTTGTTTGTTGTTPTTGTTTGTTGAVPVTGTATTTTGDTTPTGTVSGGTSTSGTTTGLPTTTGTTNASGTTTTVTPSTTLTGVGTMDPAATTGN